MTGAFLVIINALAAASSMVTNFSPAPSMFRIYKTKSCGEVQVLPLLTLWGACHLW